MPTTPITDLCAALPVPPGGIASTPLVDLKGSTKVVLFALDVGQEISAHVTPFPATLLPLQGRLKVMVGEAWVDGLPGSRVEFPLNVPHALQAVEPSHFLLVMLRGA